MRIWPNKNDGRLDDIMDRLGSIQNDVHGRLNGQTSLNEELRFIREELRDLASGIVQFPSLQPPAEEERGPFSPFKASVTIHLVAEIRTPEADEMYRALGQHLRKLRDITGGKIEASETVEAREE